jgi:hypothetical protein
MMFKTQMDAQRFLLIMVPKGYHWWVSGIEKDKASLEKLREKYAEFYGCDLSPAKKSYRKKKGLANSHFVSVPLPPEVYDGGYMWFLIATDGLGSIRQNTKLKDANTNPGRIVWGDYVMYCAPRHALEGGGVRWTWYLQPQIQRELDHHVGVLLKTAPAELKAFFDMQCKRPLHHGIRHYLTRLLRRAHQNFMRMYPGRTWTARNPEVPLPILSSYKSF